VNSALNLLRHALGLVTQRPLKTAAVVAPALVLMCGVGLSTAVLAPELLTLDPAHPDLETIKSAELSLALLIAFILSYAMMAILWHRYTLKDSHLPLPMCTQLVFGYLWRVFAIALIQLVAGVALVMPLVALGNIGSGAATNPAMVSMLLTTFVTQLLLMWLSLRLSLILPAAALGRPISLHQSWTATGPISRSLWGVAAALALINTALSALIALFGLTRPSHALALELPIYIIEGLLIFSVLTTLYSRQIQNKEIGQP
jgi:hypothetical protein